MSTPIRVSRPLIPLLILALAVSLAGCGKEPQRPVPSGTLLEVAGVPSFHNVSRVLYRGGQPTAEGFRVLEKLGIKTVVNLRSFHSDRDELKGTNLGYEHITMKPWHAEDKEVVRFLRIVTDPEKQPVFVHCQLGADRTGTMCAIYRIAVEGWTKEKAIEEMTREEFGFHNVWGGLIRYIEELDIEKIKREAGLASAPQ